MEATVRRIGPGEGPLLARLRLAALADAPGAFEATYEDEVGRPASEWADRAALAAGGEDRATFVAVAGGDPVGLVSAYRQAGGDFEVVSVWVAPAARRLGVASRLVGAALDWAASAGAGTASLWVRKGNAGALALYRNCGFTPVDECEDEVRMAFDVAGTTLAPRP